LEGGLVEFLDIKGGRIAYDVTGGPLIVLSHGIGDRRLLVAITITDEKKRDPA
jgi:hypothetical protein